MVSRASSGAACVAICALVMGTPAGVQAQHRPRDGAEGRLRVGALLDAGFGGEVKWDADTSFGIGTSGDIDLQPSAGFGFFADYPVIPYLGVGMLARAQFLHVDNVEDNASSAIDVDLMLRGRYPFAHGEVYLAVPVGFSMLWVNDDADFTPGSALDGGPGWNVGLLFGGQALVTRRIGIFGHLGGLFRGTKHDISNATVKLRTKQFVMEAGVAFLL